MAKNNQKLFYNLAGGLNQAMTDIAMGESCKKLFWADCFNVEIFKNQGVARQFGSVKILELDDNIPVISLVEFPKDSGNIVFAKKNGEICFYERDAGTLSVVKAYEAEFNRVSFVKFLDGLVIAPDNQEAYYYNPLSDTPLSPLNLQNGEGEPIVSDVVCVYAGRIWVAHGSTLFFSALGTFDDWTTEQDAGYISKFHSSTTDIIAMTGYCGNLAVYKADEVYILEGTSPENFSISKFADKGTMSSGVVVTTDNKQFFATPSGVFCLEQAGILSQISLSHNIAKNVQTCFAQIDYKKTRESFALPYEIKNQVWFFLPVRDDDGEKTVLIFDMENVAWTVRKIPYEIISGAVVSGKIVTGSKNGEIFVEDIGNNFASKPIKFRFSSPFIGLGQPCVRKIIEEFNFVFDEERENRFRFSVSKDFKTHERTDVEYISTIEPETLVWVSDSVFDNFDSRWADDENEYLFFWAEPIEEAYRTDVFDANTAVQLHIEGENLGDDFALVGLEFKDILIDE